MKRFLMVLALAGAMVGCGDDDDDDSPAKDAGPEAGPVDAGMDAARDSAVPDAAVAVKVTNAGALCTAASACTPTGATCDTMSQFGVASAGFCSATCTKSAECGTNGDCPVGELVNGSFGAAFKMGGFPNVNVGQCYAKCTAVGSQSTCQAGFVCSNLKTAFGLPATADVAGEVITRPVCIPMGGLIPRPAGDGGTDSGSPDGGTVADAGGMDSGS